MFVNDSVLTKLESEVFCLKHPSQGPPNNQPKVITKCDIICFGWEGCTAVRPTGSLKLFHLTLTAQ